MNKKPEHVERRYRNIVAVIVVLMIILALRLFVLTVVQKSQWNAAASYQNTKTLYSSSPRGNIYDRNGNLLAGNRQVFSVVFNASNLTTEDINNSSLTLINKLIENEDEYIDDFPIKFDEWGQMYYTYDEQLEEWLAENGYENDTTAAEVFETTCRYYNLDPNADRYEAMSTLRERHNIYLPINVRNMRFTYVESKEYFWNKFGIYGVEAENGLSAKECFAMLRENYLIDETLSDSDARKIFIVRNKIASNSFQKYIPLTIANDISDLSVVFLEERNLPGVEVESSTIRYYPYGSTACHLIGYLGYISEGEVDYYVNQKGYNVSEMVGKAGVESSMEDKLHGVPGVTEVQINSTGEYVATLSEQKGSTGKDVYLTIDIELQKATQDALGSLVKSNPNSRIGAAVMLDVATGDVLAMDSYPGFDLNTFADGITDEEWASVQRENPRDPVSPAPLYNNATMSAFAPGSTFKPLTAIAALKKGLDPDHWIVDEGHIEIGDLVFGCYAWNDHQGTHGTQDLEWGMCNSCNYYFACIATGYDWGNKSSLGYSISIDDIIEEARKYGLYEKTGIEIPEVSTRPVSAETKLNNYRYSAWNGLYAKASEFFPQSVYRNNEELEKNIDLIVSWIEENPSYLDLIDRLIAETDVIPEKAEDCAAMVKFDYFNMAEWTTYDVFNTSIGQGDNIYTPVQMANYVATIGNNGFRNKVSIIYGVEGEGKTVKPEPFNTETSEYEIQSVLRSMRRVCTNGTLKTAFGDYPIEVVGKTGTAEYQSIKQPDDEAEYIKAHLHLINARAGTDISWEEVEEKINELMKSDANEYPTASATADEALITLSDFKITQSMIDAYKEGYEPFSMVVALAPYDNPEVAVVVQLPEAGDGPDASGAVKEMLDAYFKLNEEKDENSDVVFVETDDNGENIMQ